MTGFSNRTLTGLLAIVFALILNAGARADDSFVAQVGIDPLRYLSLQHNQTIKTFDTYARDTLFHITGRTRLEGKPAAFAVLDMAFRPKDYFDRNILYIRNKPFRADFAHLNYIDSAEKQRIVKEGTVSLAFWTDARTRQAMEKIMSSATVKARAIQEIDGQANMLAQILDYPDFRATLFAQAIVPSETALYPNEKPWQTLFDASTHLLKQVDSHSPGYVEALSRMTGAMEALSRGWRAQDPALVNRAVLDLAGGAEAINPKAYPSLTKRKFEVLYNSLARLTWPGAALYFLGFSMFLIAWRTELRWAYITAWAMAGTGWLVHVSAIAIRWWLVEKSVGNWFESIPIKNQFESVMFSAWFGAVVALVLETGLISRVIRKITGWEVGTLHGQGVFGAAGSFVGMLSLIALFAVPFVTRQDIIGAGIKQNAGILMTYWLYIHVTLVTASYALIGMTFVLGVWYCIQYLVNRQSAILQTLDSANLTILQLAFWILGIGIITGALWADVSWGRPWGWDPKETFALITWIVYLIIVHIRFVTAGTNRALITSALSIVGFFIMLFNWIGVNFFLVGLHSYA